MKRLLLALSLMTTTGAFLYACSSDDSVANGTDGGPDTDGSLGHDGSIPGNDSGPGLDGSSPKDSGGADSSTPLDSTSAQIQAVKASANADAGAGADGGLVLSTPLPIDDAIVTFVRPAVGTDPAGFFLQSQQTGPAVFVALDPATLSPAPAPGDKISLKATAVANIVGLHEIVGLSNYARVSSGNDISALLRDVSSASDLSSKIDGYESEYIKLTGFIAQPFASNGTGNVAGAITTTGITAPVASVKLRMPTALQQMIDPVVTCQFTMTGVMWRFNTNAEPSVFSAGDIVLTCGAPQVVSAIATSATGVNVTFNRNIDLSTVLGSRFTITDGNDGGVGVTVTGAAGSGDPLTVALTTSAQLPSQSYTVTAATAITDVLGKPLDAAHTTAKFSGFTAPAILRLNELNPNVTTGKQDLLELIAVTAGSTGGIQIQQNIVASTVAIATLPNIQVAAGDLIVVHINDLTTDGGPGFPSETTDKNSCVAMECYPNAWDVIDTKLSNKDLTTSAKVLVIKTPTGGYTDGLAWVLPSATLSGTYYNEVNALIDAGMWANCGPNAYCGTDNDAAIQASANATGIGTTTGGNTLGRTSATDTNSAADWAVDAGTIGQPNF